MIILLLVTLFTSTGDYFIIKYPVIDSLRGTIYIPIDTIQVINDSTLFSSNTGNIYLSGDSTQSADILKRAIKNYYSTMIKDNRFTIERYIKISIIGQVKNAGVFFLNENTPFSEIIALSGGTLEKANLKKIKAYTKSGKVLKFNYFKLSTQGKNLRDLELTSGDVLEIPKKFTIRVGDISAIVSTIILLWSFYQTNFQNN